MTKLKNFWHDRNISLASKIRLLCTLVLSIFLYACESWTLNADIQRRIEAHEMRCYRKILNISYKDHITNEEVRSRISTAIGAHDSLLSIVKKRKMTWYGHVTRSTGPAKTILQGMYSTRRQTERKVEEDVGGQHQGMDRTVFADWEKVAHDRCRWREIARKSSVVSSNSPRVRRPTI